MPGENERDELLFGFGEDFVWGAAAAALFTALLHVFYLFGRFRGRRRGKREARANLARF